MFKKCICVILIFSFIPYLTGCTTTRQITRQELKDKGKSCRVWITTNDGKRLEVTDAEIKDEKLTGNVRGEGYQEIDLSGVEWLEVKEVDKKKTMRWVAIGITGAIALIWILSADSEEEPPCST